MLLEKMKNRLVASCGFGFENGSIINLIKALPLPRLKNMPAKRCKYHAPDAFGSKTCALRHTGTPGGNTPNGHGKPLGCRIVGKVDSILIGIYNYS